MTSPLFDRQQYEELADRVEKAAPSLHPEQHEMHFILSAYGNALAVSREWQLRGIDAIHYALIHRYHWLPSQIHSLSLHDKALALHEELQGLTLDDEAVTVWRDHYNPQSEPASPSLYSLWYPFGRIPLA
ncbi:hypothetical protein [Vreelandella olivaria]|uniref:hypothetical protein n=1 Tax=Vreelandella olivaria TaxID=390919 RepID=UPI00201E8AF1|nr:hypothetical protein [Halomonas olivaria]